MALEPRKARSGPRTDLPGSRRGPQALDGPLLPAGGPKVPYLAAIRVSGAHGRLELEIDSQGVPPQGFPAPCTAVVRSCVSTMARSRSCSPQGPRGRRCLAFSRGRSVFTKCLVRGGVLEPRGRPPARPDKSSQYDSRRDTPTVSVRFRGVPRRPPGLASRNRRFVRARETLSKDRRMRRERSGIPRPRGAARISLAEVRAYLRSCEVERIAPRVSELATTLGVSRGTLIRAFKGIQGTTPSKYLHERQVARAKEFLNRGWSIERAAREAGYGTRRAFFRSFRTVTGTTPNVYRIGQSVPRQPHGRHDGVRPKATSH
jgi:AraC-like DNA-binding protein